MSSPPDESSSEQEFSALEDYLQRLQSGELPDRASLLARYPELSSALDCLDALESIAPEVDQPAAADQAAEPIKPPGSPTSGGTFDATEEELSQAALAAKSNPFQFGDYEVIEEIGRGGMGVVYKARQKSLGRTVAVKMILAPHLASEEQVRRFDIEAKAAAGLRHPNVVAIYDAGHVDGQHYFAMQYVEGPSLAERIAEGAVDIDQAVRWVLVVARAVEHLHQQGIVHRDLKPSNILLDQADEPFVTDFGLVKMFADVDTPLTRTGVIAGTPSYMAPEQAAARPGGIGPRCDVYSLGAILYELLAGRPPFKEDNPLDTLVQVLEREPFPPRRFNRRVSRDLEQICLTCLEKSPEERYASADELADDLQRYLRGEPVEADSPGPVTLMSRWARREPALASRLVVFAIFFAVELVNYVLGFVPADFHYRISAIMVVWAVGSVVFQQILNREHRVPSVERWAGAVRYLWGGLDVILFTVVLYLADAAASPLVVGYPLLVVGSGLWFRVPLVLTTTALCIVSYLTMVLEFYIMRPDLREGFDDAYDRPIFFVVMLVALGIAVAYQVNRARALSRYYESRELG